MTSKRLMGIGDSIMFSNKRDTSRNNISGILDKSIKSIKTASTYATPKRNNNLKHLINSYTLNKKNSVNKEKILNGLNNIIFSNNSSKISNINKGLMTYIHTEPNKESKELINNADQLLKERRSNHLVMNQLVKSVFMKKTNEIRLDNYKLKLLTNKRNELNSKLNDISKAFKSTEKMLENDYKQFLLFVEENNKSQQNQEYILNKCKQNFNNKDNEYNKQNELNKKLKNTIEFIVKRILTLNNYGKFIHKVFKKDYIYENIHKSEEKNYLNVADDLIEVYEKNEKNNFNDKLLDECWLIAQFKEFEQNLINIINEKESFRKDFLKIEYYDKSELDKLIKKKEELQKRLEAITEERDTFIKSIRTYDSPNILDTVLDCIVELTNILELKNPSTTILLKEKNENNFTVISSDLIKIIKEKENQVNNLIDEIEKVTNGENIENKQLIEEFISERKKEIKKEKLFKLIKQQKEEIRKKNVRAVQRAHRVVIKGRKVIDYYPFIKPKKKKKIIIKTKNDNDDYLYYSSDDDNK